MVNSETRQPWVFIIPGDPAQKAGGYTYVRSLVAALNEEGQPARILSLAGLFPKPDQEALASMEHALANLPDGSLVVADGLALGGMTEAIEPHLERLRLLALVHHPLADEAGLEEKDRRWLLKAERKVLAQVRGIITTSSTTARSLLGPERYRVDPERIRVVEPGVEQAEPVKKQVGARSLRLLSVGHISRRKAQGDLVEALSGLKSPDWVCYLVGSPDRDREYAREVSELIAGKGLTEQVHMTGELSDEDLADAYRNADLFVLPSHYEGYGMVVDEAFAWGLPVISSDGGALQSTADRPGAILYPAGDIPALRALLETLLARSDKLEALTQGALDSRADLKSWPEAARRFQAQVRNLVGTAAGAARGTDTQRFDETWLALRRPADHQARHPQLTAQAAGWLAQYELPEVVDLGTGTGSNYRYLNARLSSDTRWYLMDQDEILLARLQEQLEAGARVDVRKTWLTADSLEEQIPESVSLITASALIDLVSREWLESLAGVATQRGAAILMVLSYDGTFELAPRLPADDKVQMLVNAHQRRNRGAGRAAGPKATVWLAEALEQRDYEVTVADSPWHLDRQHTSLQVQLIESWTRAAREQFGDSPDWLLEWQELRLSQASAGELIIRVGHKDLFAAPRKGS